MSTPAGSADSPEMHSKWDQKVSAPRTDLSSYGVNLEAYEGRITLL